MTDSLHEWYLPGGLHINTRIHEDVTDAKHPYERAQSRASLRKGIIDLFRSSTTICRRNN